MGRGKGKGKKSTVSNHDDAGSGEEEKIPMQKRRGRPQKPLKDELTTKSRKSKEEDGENGKADITTNERKSPPAAEIGKKRKHNPQVKERPIRERREWLRQQTKHDDSSKSNGFRQSGVGVRVSRVELLKQSSRQVRLRLLYRCLSFSLCQTHDE
ncbi:G-type lectin S-receptor-like serine/threonine-protein kinase RLK1-like [Hibiscus syriacus]|uniref:G-type lectin S-receptor-like serine/threonine-protein kinase RLK1-like n=1 Tax=Hibiscus syriacus TaxID=106335 RepID=A0A6A2XHH9_HIBSY|nr:uncharacterized protein LOC120168095 [Hibiscus syriacus]XP_039032854.1 uncharacterized protein LOC120168095 [Hibiscus syriacus]KAE8674968.1 G-type lectin S-receptor-like serine/threonine-protein kinase RLK1-like [Hibiscus syriacus]